MIPGFEHTVNQLGDRIRHERERLESEKTRYFPYDDPILEEVLGDLRRNAQREDRIVQIWAWLFAIVGIGGLMGLCVWLLPAELLLWVSVSLMVPAAIGLSIVWWDRRKYPSGGTL